MCFTWQIQTMDFLNNRHDLRDVDVSNKWKLIMTDTEIQNRVKKCADIINEKFAGKDIVLTCILEGAAYFFVDLSRLVTIPYSCYFLKASSYKDGQSQSDKIELMSRIVPSEFANKEVILIDELYDNGHTMKKVKDAIHEKGQVPLDRIFTCTLFRKYKPGQQTDLDLFGIDVPNVWLVGYGLDDQQEKRGWTHLFGCPKLKDIPETPDDAIFSDNDYYLSMRQQIIKQLS